MKWIDTAPTEEGLYWFKNGDDGRVMVVEFFPEKDDGFFITKPCFRHLNKPTEYVYKREQEDQWSDKPLNPPNACSENPTDCMAKVEHMTAHEHVFKSLKRLCEGIADDSQLTASKGQVIQCLNHIISWEDMLDNKPKEEDIMAITASYDTLMDQAIATADLYLRRAVKSINEQFGDGYAEANPNLIAAFMQTANADMTTSVAVVAIQEAAKEIAGSISFLPPSLG